LPPIRNVRPIVNTPNYHPMLPAPPFVALTHRVPAGNTPLGGGQVGNRDRPSRSRVLVDTQPAGPYDGHWCVTPPWTLPL